MSAVPSWLVPSGMAAFVLASLVVGGRLLLVARRTRELPELAMGLAFFLGGGLGYVFNFLSVRQTEALGAWAGPLGLLGLLCTNVGTGALWIFTWRVFRRDAVWARALCALALGAMGLGFAGQYVQHGLGPRAFGGGWFWLGFAPRALGFAWTSWESLRYHALLRRRQRLGLVDPGLARRFLLWGLGAAAIFTSFCVTGASLLAGAGPFSTLPSSVLSTLGLATAVMIWLAFFPNARLAPRASP